MNVWLINNTSNLLFTVDFTIDQIYVFLFVLLVPFVSIFGMALLQSILWMQSPGLLWILYLLILKSCGYHD